MKTAPGGSRSGRPSLGGRFLKTVLFETSSSDPLSVLLAVSISMATVLFACALPARRAARLDPKTTLHLD